MILGQAEWYEKSWYERGDFALALGPIGGLALAAANTIDSIKNAITGGGDVAAGVSDNTPAIPDLPSDVGTDVVGAGKATARRPSATTESDAGYYSMSEAKPVWPWILGIGLLGGGAWWFIKRRKRARKGK